MAGLSGGDRVNDMIYAILGIKEPPAVVATIWVLAGLLIVLIITRIVVDIKHDYKDLQ